MKKTMSRAALWICLILMLTPSVIARPQVHVTKRFKTHTLPSLSGIEYYRGHYYAICDDTPWIYRLDKTLRVKKKIELKSYHLKNGRIPKNKKPDYEALSLSKWEGEHLIIVLGSGSHSPKRDFAYIYNMEKNKTHSFKLTKFYKHLKKLAHIKHGHEINIEGIASTGHTIYILNRGNSGHNYIFKISEEEFINYLLKHSSHLPKVKAYHIELPEIAGIEASFSGACYLARENALVVTASVEASEGAYDDGAILGSFVGFIHLKNLKHTKKMESHFTLLVDKNHIVPTKLESVVVTGRHEGRLNALLVSDNDNGVSEFFKVTIRP